MKFIRSILAAFFAATILAACLGGGGGSSTTITPPSAPTNVVSMAGDGQATVTFSAPESTGGSAIDGYTVASSPAGGVDSNSGTTSLSHVITGLINGTAYTFTVTAHNSAGTSSASEPSSSVIPIGSIAGAWNVAASLITIRAGHTATLLQNGKVLVVGGEVGLNPLTSAELYDPLTNTWTATGSLATARTGHTATLLTNGKVLVVGGKGISGALTSAELYDPGTNTWIAAGSLVTAREDHTATRLQNGKVLVVGGYDGINITLASTELYDPATNTWTSAGSLATARTQHSATLLPNGQVLVVGGVVIGGGGILRSAEFYDQTTNVWTTAGQLATGRYLHTATLLQNGKVLVVGGYTYSLSSNIGTSLTSTELYDPATNTWSVSASLNQDRESHTATLLSNGNLLVVGGESVLENAWHYQVFLPSAELYDPTNNIWTLVGGLSQGRASHTATLLNNGSVLVAGGVDGLVEMNSSGNYLPSAELYVPTFN